jgi:hypothetical protein
MKSYNDEKSEYIYHLFDFRNKKSFKSKKFNRQRAYIIAKEDFNKGINYLNNKSTKKNTKYIFDPNKMKFFFKLKDIKDYDGRDEFSIVTKEFLEKLKIDKQNYQKYYTYFLQYDKYFNVPK